MDYPIKSYAYPILMRAGLGNMLFAWARAFLWSKDHQVELIAPYWTKIRLGPYIRREKDKRNYQYLFNSNGYITGVKRIILLATIPKYDEREITKSKPNFGHRKSIIVFRGMEGMFKPLLGRNNDIFSELMRITRQKYLNINNFMDNFIGIHVRRGDFFVSTDPSYLRNGGDNGQIPIDWYIIVINSLRKKLGFEAPAVIFTDGSMEEIGPLINLPQVQLFPSRSAITDLLTLSGARVLIASGSTFSMWASYLGQVPSIWYPGQKKQTLINTSRKMELEIEFENENDIRDDFIMAIDYRRFKG